ncbi:protein UsfY [Mycolicibacterium nivoides]|uniref:protein UsfY n=1 Tax=Mycolicibacterium nivoides TaxID=2487344 RepID=UPI003C2C0305
MGNTRDPIDHFRTHNKHAGEQFVDMYCWPGLMSILLGAISLAGGVAAAAYGRPEWFLRSSLMGLLAISAGIAWLVVEHRRVVWIERHWQEGYSATSPATQR